MDRWYEPLESEVCKEDSGLYWLDFKGWFPSNGVVVGSPNGSMTMDLIPQIIDHIAKYASSHHKPGQNVLLLLDGNRSSNGVDWLYAARNKNIEIEQLSNNTTHFLQSNDQDTNLILNRAVRAIVSFLTSMNPLVNLGDMGMKL